MAKTKKAGKAGAGLAPAPQDKGDRRLAPSALDKAGAPKAAEYRRERREVAVGALKAAPWNPRGEITPESVADLAASVASLGLVQPLVAMEDMTLVAGHRRLAAAKAAGLGTVPVDVLVGVDEATARRMTFVENLQRRDADPLLESDLVNGLVESGMTREEIAAETGRGREWVSRRLNLANLSESWRARVAGGERITTDCLEHVAAYPAEVQERLKNAENWDHSQPLRWHDVRQRFVSETCDLKEATFNRKACRSCPKNTGCAPDLFDWEGRVTAFGKCMDAKCFRRMTGLAVEKAKESAKRDGLLVCERKERPDYEADLQDRRDGEHATLYVWTDWDGDTRMQWGRAPSAKAGAATEEDKEARRRKVAAGKARRKLAEWCGANLAGAIARRYRVDVPVARAFQTLFDLGTSWRVFGSLTDAKDAALAYLLDPSASDAACVEWPEMAAPDIAAKVVRAEIGGTYAARLLAVFPEAEAALTEEERRLVVTDERLAELRAPAKVAWCTDGTDAEAEDAALTGEEADDE